MEDAPVIADVVPEAPVSVPEPEADAVAVVEAVVVEAVVEAPVVEAVVVEAPVAADAVPVVEAPSLRSPLDIKLLLLGPARKNIKETKEDTFRLTDAKQAQVLACLKAAFPAEDSSVSDDGKTITIGADHTLSFLVQDDSPFIMIHSFGDEDDHSRVYKLNVTLFQLLL